MIKIYLVPHDKGVRKSRKKTNTDININVFIAQEMLIAIIAVSVIDHAVIAGILTKFFHYLFCIPTYSVFSLTHGHSS